MTTTPRSPSSSGSPAAIAAAPRRSTLKVPIRFTRTTVSKGWSCAGPCLPTRSEEHTSELQSLTNLVCRLLLEKKKQNMNKRVHETEKKKSQNRPYIRQPV